MARKILETEQKALEINLDDLVYGTFSEIGAGQEVARYFFQVGAAAGTIAKSMSAYDKVYSDKIYGQEPNGRYVCEPRLYRMLNYEYNLMVDRLRLERPNSTFFVFADTVAAINYSRTIQGDGWLGLRFQLHPEAEPNDLVIHVKMQDNNNQLQQQAIGIVGVNMIYACYRYNNDANLLIQSLIDGLKGRVTIDMIRLTGPDFQDVDNRLLTLKLVQFDLTDVSMFDGTGKPVHASEFLYKKNVMIVRGSYRPLTLVNLDMIQRGFEQFRKEADVDASKSIILTEITVNNLSAHGPIDEQDFLDRAELLCELGQTVVISNCDDHFNLINYLNDYKVPKLGIVVGVRQLLDLITEKYYENMDGDLLSYFGKIFKKHVRYYIYPSMQEGSADLMQAHNLPVPEGVRFLYKHLLDNRQVLDVQNFNPEILHIFSQSVHQMITNNEHGWEAMVPRKVVSVIKERYLFGFPSEQLEFEY